MIIETKLEHNIPKCVLYFIEAGHESFDTPTVSIKNEDDFIRLIEYLGPDILFYTQSENIPEESMEYETASVEIEVAAENGESFDVSD